MLRENKQPLPGGQQGMVGPGRSGLEEGQMDGGTDGRTQCSQWGAGGVWMAGPAARVRGISSRFSRAPSRCPAWSQPSLDREAPADSGWWGTRVKVRRGVGWMAALGGEQLGLQGGECVHVWVWVWFTHVWYARVWGMCVVHMWAWDVCSTHTCGMYL